MLEKIKELLAEELNIDVEDITLESDIKKDLGADSLDILELLMGIEDEYGITIPDEELAGFNTIQDVVDYLESAGVEIE